MMNMRPTFIRVDIIYRIIVTNQVMNLDPEFIIWSGFMLGCRVEPIRQWFCGRSPTGKDGGWVSTSPPLSGSYADPETTGS